MYRGERSSKTLGKTYPLSVFVQIAYWGVDPGGTMLIRQSIRSLCLHVGVSLVVLLACGQASAAQMEIVINLPAFTLYLYRDGVVFQTYPIGIGSTVNPSQLGTTSIINEVHYPTYYPPDWYRRGLEPIPPGPDNPVGTRWLGLGFRGYGIHGTNQPWTIGTAASAGCIRMHNADVEALAELVGVGVPVTFMYETIEAWRDPLTHTPLIKVHKDIYRQGTSSLERALEALSRIDARHGVDVDLLQGILAEEAGMAQTVPYSVPLYLDGSPLEFGAVRYGGRLLLPLHSLARHFGDSLGSSRSAQGAVMVGGRVVPNSFFVADRAYAPVDDAAYAFGLSVEAASSEVRLQSVRLVSQDVDLSSIRTFIAREWLLIPVQELGRRFGVDVRWDNAAQAVLVEGRPAFGSTVIDGRAYVPHDRAESLLGVRVRWSPGSFVAEVLSPKVRIPGREGEERAFWRDGQVFVPLRLIAGHLGVTLGWNQTDRVAYIGGVPVQGVVREGRVYTPLSSLDGVVSGLKASWDNEGYLLELRFGDVSQ